MTAWYAILKIAGAVHPHVIVHIHRWSQTHMFSESRWSLNGPRLPFQEIIMLGGFLHVNVCPYPDVLSTFRSAWLSDCVPYEYVIS